MVIGFISYGCIFMVLFMSLRWLWISRSNHNDLPNLTLSLENFILLLLTYVNMIIGFGLIYFLLEINGVGILIEFQDQVPTSVIKLLETSMYFSAVTIFTVGYGDITPIGIGRWIAMIEALIGYVLSAAFVVRTVIDSKQN